MSRVSVIVPCFNSELYIKKCLDSLEKQTIDDFEVIIVDDCSSDDSVDVIEKLKKKYRYSITILRNKINRGPAYSRYRGISASKSEVVAFCDSDDWYDNNFLEIMLEAIECSKADIAICGYKVVGKKGIQDQRPFTYIRRELDNKEALQIGADSMCMLVVKRELLLKCPWPDIRNGEDMALVPILISRSNKCTVIPECLYNYFTRSNSASNNISKKVIDSLIYSFYFVVDNIPEGFEKECEFIGVNNLLYGALISLFTLSLDKAKALKIVTDFEQKFPNWDENPYIRRLQKYKKVELLFVKNRWFYLLRLLAIVRNKRK